MTSSGMAFEQDVRRIARSIWNLPPGDGSSEFIDGQEIDCVCRTDDIVHLIECTLDRKLDKVTHDVNKLVHAKRAEERNGNTAKAWIVTGEEPTPQQRTQAKSNAVSILSISQFRTRLFDAGEYLNARWAYRFGSATDAASGSSALSDDEYVALPLTDMDTKQSYSVQSLVDMLVVKRAVVVLLGPFGAGKSLTLREIFKNLRARYYRDSEPPIPIALNLREHWGQTDSDEVLRRHAAKIGFANRDKLVRAWNAGILVPLLDGFDEVAAQAWRIAPSTMKQTRKEALGLVRAFTDERQGRSGILISGRDHYFDSADEMRAALRLPSDAKRVMIGEFTEEQAQAFLKKKGVSAALPSWLPRKPLLLSYLAVRKLLQDVLTIPGEKGAAFAWNAFLDKICEREAKLSSDIEGPAVRRLLEQLASKARGTAAGVGPLTESDLSSSYTSVTGTEPLEAARALLQRLPGLTARDQEQGARSFIDVDMLDSLAGSSVARYCANPYSPPDSINLQHPLGQLGCAVAAVVADSSDVPLAAHKVGAREAISRWSQPTLAADCLVSGSLRTQSGLACDELTVQDALINTLDFETMPLSEVVFQWCQIETINISDSEPTSVSLTECIVDRLIGASDKQGLPPWIVKCEIGEFDSAQTNAAILKLPVAVPVRVVLTILRKLFLQRGRGRRESAFYRGLDQKSARFVKPILAVIRGHGVAAPSALGGDTVWHALHSQRARVMQLLATIGAGDDPLIQEIERLQ